MPAELSEFDQRLMEKLLSIPKGKWRMITIDYGHSIFLKGFETGKTKVFSESCNWYGETVVGYYIMIGNDRLSTNSATPIYAELRERFDAEIAQVDAERKNRQAKAKALAEAEGNKKEQQILDRISATPTKEHQRISGSGCLPLLLMVIVSMLYLAARY